MRSWVGFICQYSERLFKLTFFNSEHSHDEDDTASISTSLTDDTSHQEHKSATHLKVGLRENHFLLRI